MPLAVEIGAFGELAEATDLAESWEKITGIPFPRDEDDWFELVGRGDIPVELFVSGKIRPRQVLRYLEGRLAQPLDSRAWPKRAKASAGARQPDNVPVLSPGALPDDLISMAVAVAEYGVSRSTLRRAIRDGRLRSYRAPGSATNTGHRLSRRELSSLFPRRG